MTFPCDTPTKHALLQDAQGAARRVRDITTDTRNLASPNFEQVRVCWFGLEDAFKWWDAAAARAGMGAYAQDQLGDAILDIAAEHTAMRAAAVVFRDWIRTNWPTDAYTADTTNGRLVPRVLTTTERNAFRTQADLFLATLPPKP